MLLVSNGFGFSSLHEMVRHGFCCWVLVWSKLRTMWCGLQELFESIFNYIIIKIDIHGKR
jgi:hypothetical protein